MPGPELRVAAVNPGFTHLLCRLGLAARCVRRLIQVFGLTVWHTIPLLTSHVRDQLSTDVDGKRFGTALASFMESLGPTYIKLAQLISARPDLLSRCIREPLSRLQDRVRPAPKVSIRRELEKQFGDRLDLIFDRIMPTAVAGGSIAQVHQGYLADGTEVAVKIRRPEVLRRLECDLVIMRTGARLLSFLAPFRSVPMQQCFSEIQQLLWRQLDFRLEAEHLRAVGENLADFPSVQVPRLIEAACTPGVLTMEYVRGLTRLESVKHQDPESVRQCMTLGVRCLYKMIFVDGLVHADLHPGNILYSSGSLVFLDFGIVTELDTATREDFVTFFYGIVTNDGSSCAEIVLRQASSVPTCLDRHGFTAAVADLVNDHSGMTAATYEITRFVSGLFRIQREFGLVGSSLFVSVIVALLSFESLAKSVCPTLNFQAEARHYLPGVRAQSFPRRPWPGEWYSNLNSWTNENRIT